MPVWHDKMEKLLHCLIHGGKNIGTILKVEVTTEIAGRDVNHA
jgi:hypothetical protein